MTSKLMTSALCWEFQRMVSVDLAHQNANLSFYCPVVDCLRPLTPSRRINLFFRAVGGHVSGCPHQKDRSEESIANGISRPKPSPLQPPPIPTMLGEAPRPTVKRAPTLEDLRELAQRVTALPPLHKGTLCEVVDAWTRMNTADRNIRPLSVEFQTGTYGSVFQFLKYVEPDIARIADRNRIAFGAVKVRRGKYCYFVDSVKRFKVGDELMTIGMDIAKTHRFSGLLDGLVGKPATLFWRGEIDASDASAERSRIFLPLLGDPYEGPVLRAGEFYP